MVGEAEKVPCESALTVASAMSAGATPGVLSGPEIVSDTDSPGRHAEPRMGTVESHVKTSGCMAVPVWSPPETAMTGAVCGKVEMAARTSRDGRVMRSRIRKSSGGERRRGWSERYARRSRDQYRTLIEESDSRTGR